MSPHDLTKKVKSSNIDWKKIKPNANRGHSTVAERYWLSNIGISMRALIFLRLDNIESGLSTYDLLAQQPVGESDLYDAEITFIFKCVDGCGTAMALTPGHTATVQLCCLTMPAEIGNRYASYKI